MKSFFFENLLGIEGSQCLSSYLYNLYNIVMETGEIVRKILSGLQRRWGQVFQHQVVNLVAYGSAAMPQTKDKKVFSSNTMDLLVEVRHPDYFHRQLMRSSPDDYAGAPSLFGSGVLKWTDQSVFPMHSNHITLDGRKIKYSVIGNQALREDLQTWKYLSFAGRLHKPILPLRPLAEGLDDDIHRNRESAVAIALLLFGGKARFLPHFDLFCKICEISYMGDIRFSAGAENPNKVANIVEHNMGRFRDIYLPILRNMSQKMPKDLMVEPDHISYLFTAPSLSRLITYLPYNISKTIGEYYPGERHIVERILLAGSGDFPKDLKQIISKINRKSSFWMATQNMLSASPINNLSYLAAKLAKKSSK